MTLREFHERMIVTQRAGISATDLMAHWKRMFGAMPKMADVLERMKPPH